MVDPTPIIKNCFTFFSHLLLVLPSFIHMPNTHKLTETATPHFFKMFSFSFHFFYQFLKVYQVYFISHKTNTGAKTFEIFYIFVFILYLFVYIQKIEHFKLSTTCSILYVASAALDLHDLYDLESL